MPTPGGPHLQVRQQLTGGSVPGSKDRSSPYGTPKALRSPMASPLISDPKAMAALDLNPGTTRVVRTSLPPRMACAGLPSSHSSGYLYD